jgi:hypothetical protein
MWKRRIGREKEERKEKIEKVERDKVGELKRKVEEISSLIIQIHQPLITLD